MKKFYLFLALAFLAGYLAYDWYTAVQAEKQPSKVTHYTWSDAKGVKHFTDAPPPAGARNVEKSTGVAQPREPLAVRMMDQLVAAYRNLRSQFKDEPAQPKKYKRVL